MRHVRRSARLALAATLPVLLLAGCGDDESPDTDADPFDRVEVVGTEDAPELEVETPVAVAETVVDVVRAAPADAPVVAEGDLVSLDVLAVDGSDGSVLQSTFGQPTRLSLLADPRATVQGLITGVVGEGVGSRVLVAVSPQDFPVAPPAGATAPSTTDDGSTLLLVDIEAASPVLERAEGTELEVPAGLPAVTRGADGAPAVAAPEGEAPTELRVETLVQSEGEPVASGDTVVVQYTGVLWSDGEVFDSSWQATDRLPFTFTVGGGQVIDAWDEGLEGVPVGSQVMIVAPPDTAYGDSDSGGAIPPGSTLVFVVDVLAALPTIR